MRRPAFALTVALATLASIGLVERPASAAPRDQRATGAPRITLLGQSTWVPADGDFLIGVRVSGAPADGNVRISVHRALRNRAAFDDAANSDEAGRELFNLDLLPVDQLPPGPDGTRTVSQLIRTGQSSTTAQTEQTGVYPVQVRLLQHDGTVLARLTTFLVRLPTNPLGPDRLRAALLLPLHAALTVRPDASVGTDTRGIASIRTIVDALGARPDLPATLVPTPQSVDALHTSGPTDTALFRDMIQVSQTGRQVLASPFVRVDATAWLAADLAHELTREDLVGASVLSSMIPNSDHRTWLADPDLTPSTLSHLRGSGVQQLVIPERALAPLDERSFPDGSTEPFKVETDAGVPMPAVQIDGRLRAGFTRTSDPALGANQLLAELALLSFRQERVRGAVVLAPPDDWQPTAAFLSVLLDGLSAGNPVTTPTTVDQIFAEVPPAGTQGSAASRSGADRGVDLVRTLTPRPTPSLGQFPERVKELRGQLDSYASMVGPTSARVAPFDRRLLLAGSADLTTRQRNRLLSSVAQGLNHQFNSVVAPLTERVTLTSRNADFPLTLQSKLGYPVNVVIDLQASNRLTFPGGNRIQKKLEGQRTRVKLRVRAPVSGDTPVQVTVHSPDGKVVLATSRYTVRVTAVSGVGVVLTIGAALFLLIWWVRHWRTSARQRNGSAAS